ncbi:MAG TPA: GxxExxY protein [Burkholderiaceae bacterium]
MENEISEKVIGAAMEVHRTLGPGLLESAYAAALAIELQERGCAFEREKAIHASYKGQQLGAVFRADFVVENCLVLELKAVDTLAEQHASQLLTYLRLTDLRLGLLINFNQATLVKGLRRVINSP